MNDKPISDLRRRMIANLTVRRFSNRTQHEYGRHIEIFAGFLGRSPNGVIKDQVAVAAAYSQLSTHMSAPGTTTGA
jgi:hypothetical protein